MSLTHETIKTLDRDVTMVHGKFALGASSAVGTVTGSGFSVAKTSTGKWTVTFSNNFGTFYGAHACMETASGSDKFCQTGGYTSATKALVLFGWDVSSNALADPASGDDIHFVAFFVR